MRRPWLLVVLLLAGAAGEARAAYPYHCGWTWREKPDEAAVRLAVADMRRIAATADGAVIVAPGDDSSIALSSVKRGAQSAFAFPLGYDRAHFGALASEPVYAEVVAACCLVIRERLGRAVDVRFDDDEEVVERAVERYMRALGSAPGAGAMPSYVGSALGSLLYPGLMALFFIIMMARGGGTWTSYYLFWWVAPVVIFAIARQPLVLLLVPVAVVARRVLPDPIQLIRRGGRIRALSADVNANPHNVTARRALAMLWLDLRRPRKALPLVEQALEREPEDAELHYLRGLALLGARRWDPALASFLEVLEREPRMRYGDAYLRGADALLALRRWPEAEEGLDHFTQVNKSTVEGWVKLARARREQGDAAGAAAAIAQAKATYKGSPSFHRRKQLWWYLRALVGR